MLELRDWVRMHYEEAARLQQTANDCQADGPMGGHFARQYADVAAQHEAEADSLRLGELPFGPTA
ncbi:hypothetical protein ACFVYT_24840 [Streptomyces sp. NPDC058290]|uniref:hypothetical protein n=1 Tax=Streptomyces sp. NPDC058290 TaxID=3346426 RepID=UPI0036E59610